MSKYLFLICVVIIFIFSIGTRVNNLGLFSFDFDEIWSAKFTLNSYRDIITGTRYDPGNPPLYFFILKVWKSVIGESELKFRMLSVIFYGLAFIALYIQAHKRITNISLVGVLLLFGGSGLIFFLTRYVRAYALLLLLSICVFPLLFRYIHEKKHYIIYGVFALLLSEIGLYSHYSFVVYFILLFLTFLFHVYKNKPLFLRLLVFYGVALWAYLPWAIPFLINQFTPRMQWYKYGFGQVQEKWIGFEGWLQIFTNNISTYIPLVTLQTYVGVFIVILFVVVGIKTHMRQRSLLNRYTLFFSILSIVSVMFTPLHRVFNNPRYSVFILPFLFSSIGIIMDTFMNNKTKMVIIAMLIPFSLFTYNSYTRIVEEDWKSLSKKLPITSMDTAILYDPCSLAYSLDYYYKSKIPQYCFSNNRDGMYLSVWDKTRFDKLYILFYHWDTNFDDTSLTELLDEYSIIRERFENIELVTLDKLP